MADTTNKKSGLSGILRSKSLWGSLLFSIGLWAYTSLNGDYVSVVDVPFSIKLPETRAILNPIRKTISVEVKGKGWNIFELLFLNSGARIYVDLSSVSVGEGSFEIGRNEIIRSVQSFKNLEAINVYPERITIETGIISIQNVAIDSRINIIPREGFTIVGKPKIFPDSVEIRGNKKLVNRLIAWPTKPVTISDIHESSKFIVNLSDSLSGLLDKSISQVTVQVEIQQTAEATFEDIPVKISGGFPPKDHRLMPPMLRVTLRGGAEVISGILPDMIGASIDYNQIIYDTTGLIRPEITIPENTELLSINPPLVYHLKRIKLKSLARN